MTVRDLDEVEIAAQVDEALAVFLELARASLTEASTTFQPTPMLNVNACRALEALGIYERRRRTLRRAVAG